MTEKKQLTHWIVQVTLAVSVNRWIALDAYCMEVNARGDLIFSTYIDGVRLPCLILPPGEWLCVYTSKGNTAIEGLNIIYQEG